MISLLALKQLLEQFMMMLFIPKGVMILKYKRLGLSTAEVCKLVGRSRSSVKAYSAAMRKYGMLSPLPQSARQLALNFTAAETVTSIAFRGE